MAASTLPHAISDARYEILRMLGEGSTGAVYLARDLHTGDQVALKKLLRMDHHTVLRLKREFRALADLHHPNLAQLYDLGRGSDAWFLTMEYIAGFDLLSYLGHEPRSLEVSRTRVAGHARSTDRTLSAFHQLACGIQALHQAGMLHRDLKPSNVLVADDRVVVLDFGLVRELDAQSTVVTADGFISGTPAYMAPEQALGQPLSEVADWYAFGVMLYQVLSGRLPVDAGSAIELLLRKRDVDPLPLEQLVPELSPGLYALCSGLLRRDPAERPSGDLVVSVLEYESARLLPLRSVRHSQDFGTLTLTRGPAANVALFGRERELMQLLAAAHDAHRGEAVVVHVRGSSGAGKSALVEHFLSTLEQESGRALVLRSRCYEREAMPFKALDGVMDALVGHLAELDDFDVGHLLPADVAELAQLFPALERLPAVRRLLQTSVPRGDALQIRLRAEVALRELLARLASRKPLVLWIDDLQWGDLDSASILKHWPKQLRQASLALVLSYRSEEVTTSPCLRWLLDRDDDAHGAQATERVLDIAPLAAADVRLLCMQRLGALASERPDLVQRIADESHGNPFLVQQLAALVQAKLARGDQDLATLSIEQLIVQTTELLPPEAAGILAVLAIAGRPLSPRLALRAAGVRSDGPALLHALRGVRLIRARDVAGEQLVETYHDRVREGVQASLAAAERQRVHERLLDALEQEQGETDADWLHTLALGAGRSAVALQHGLLAAKRASNTLAFERAAALYQKCIELSDPAAADSGKLWFALATALVRCGQGARAAEAYLEAAKRADSRDAVPMMRLAASHLLRSGEFARGEAIVREVLAALRLSLPTSDAGVLAAIVWERGALELRGLHYAPTAERDVSAELLQKIDLFTPLSIENQAHDPLRAALIQARSLRWALAAGEPRRVARALLGAATMTCVSGSARAARQTDDLLARADAIARELNSESLHGDIQAARAVCSFLLGRPAAVLAPSEDAERIYRAGLNEDAQGDYYHRFAVVAVRIGALNVLGQHQRALVELQNTLREARATNNRSAVLHLTLCQAFSDEFQNQPASSKSRLAEQRKQLPANRFGPLHLLHMLAVMRIACASQDYAWASAWVEEDWARWKRSPVRASAYLSLVALASHQRFLLNRHVVERRSGDAASLVRSDLRAFGRLPFEQWRIAGQCRIKARLAYLEGQPTAAAAWLRKGLASIAGTGAADEETRDRYALGVILGAGEGAQLRAEADATLRAKGWADPIADLRANYPELPISR